jgi:hypothetical protein
MPPETMSQTMSRMCNFMLKIFIPFLYYLEPFLCGQMCNFMIQIFIPFFILSGTISLWSNVPFCVKDLHSNFYITYMVQFLCGQMYHFMLKIFNTTLHHLFLI